MLNSSIIFRLDSIIGLADLTSKNISDLIPGNFKTSNNLRRTGQAGILAGSLELVKEGNVSIKQNKLFDDIYIKEN